MTDSDPIVYLNGEYLPKSQARFSVEDRGALFGDGVYEVTRYYGGQPFEMQAHLDRLRHSLKGISLPEPPHVAELPAISDELIRRNGFNDATVYWQVTRGPAPRNRLFPDDPRPTVLAIVYPASALELGDGPATITVTVAEDTRWSQCHIKALILLPTMLARNAAHARGFGDAIYQRDGVVTETTGANLFIVRDDELHTHPADRWILHGITRRVVFELAETLGIAVHEQPFTVDQMLAADEVLITGTTTQITAVTQIDEQAFEVGAVTSRLSKAFAEKVHGNLGE